MMMASQENMSHEKSNRPLFRAINIRAIWNRKLSRFQVEVNHGQRLVQMMTEDEFRAFVGNLDVEIRIAGWKLVLNGDEGGRLTGQIKDYLRAVLASYDEAKWRGQV